MKPKLRFALIACVMTLMASAFVYGLVRWPDGPIHACDATRNYAIKSHPEGYCGKQGQPRTLADYQALGMALWIILYYAKRRSTS